MCAACPGAHDALSLRASGDAELNTDRFGDPKLVETDNWEGGFYLEVWVDGWDVDKTVTIDFHTDEIEFPKHARQTVRCPPAAAPCRRGARAVAPSLSARQRSCADRRVHADDGDSTSRSTAVDLL